MPDDAKRSASRTTRAVIDRIEDGERAVLLWGEQEEMSLDMPARMLPQGAADGDHVQITVTLDPESRADAEERIKQLQERLSKRSDASGKKDFKL